MGSRIPPAPHGFSGASSLIFSTDFYCEKSGSSEYRLKVRFNETAIPWRNNQSQVAMSETSGQSSPPSKPAHEGMGTPFFLPRFDPMIEQLLRHCPGFGCSLLAMLISWASCLPSEAAATLAIAQDPPAPLTVDSGDNVELRVLISVGVEAAQSVVIWVKLPDHGSPSLVYPSATHPTAPYPGQNDEPTFISATRSGQFTSSEIMVSGITIPARSVYWTSASLSSGSTFSFSTILRAKPGTLQGTIFKITAFAAASNVTSVQSVERTATVSATSTANLQNIAKAGIYPISNQNHTQPGTDNTLGFQLANSAASGSSTLYQTTVYEDLSALVPFIDEGGDGLDASDFADITSGGVFQSNFIPPLGGVARPAIVWFLPSLAPGESAEGSFRFHLRNDPSLPPGATQYTSSVIVESPQLPRQTSSVTVSFPLPESPVLISAIGEQIRGLTSLSSGQDHPLLSLGNAEIFQIILQSANGSAIELDDIVIFYKIPTSSTFTSAILPAVANGSIFYATTTDGQFTPANPPPVDPSRAPDNLDFEDGALWQNIGTSPPVDPGSVTWLAVHIPRLSSPFFPTGPPPGVETEITLRARLQDPCVNEVISSSSLVRVYRKTLLNGQSVDAGPVQVQSETELTTVISTKPTISGSASFSTINLTPGSEFEFRLPLSNSNVLSSADLSASQLRLQWPAVQINGVPTFFELLETSPAAIISGDPALGDVTIDFGSLAKGASRSFTARFKAPAAGLAPSSAFQASATLTWSDVCPSNSFTASKTALIISSPVISGTLEPLAAHTPPGGLIDYTATISNIGTGIATGAFAIVPVPVKTVFVKAMHPADGTPIHFSNATYPAFDSRSYPVSSPGFVQANFTAGIPSDNGTPDDTGDDFWISPFGEATTTLAFSMDDPVINIFPSPSGPRTIRWQLRNDEDPGPSQLDSPVETLISAEIGVFSSGLPLAISNLQTTVIRDTPSPQFLIFDGPDDNSPPLSDGQLAVVNFGTTLVGEPHSRTFTVKNTGVGNLIFSSITLPSRFSEAGSPLAGTAIAPGLTAQIQVALNVNSAANFSGPIRFFRFTGDSNPFDFPISGIVQNPPTPDFELVAPGATITPDSLNQFPGEIEFTMTVRNKDAAGLATTSTASLSWPFIDVNGVSQAAELISVSPSAITSDFRESGFIDVNFGALSPGETKTLSARFRIPRGTKPQSFEVFASVSSSTPSGFTSASGSADAQLIGSPAVQIVLPALPTKTPAGSDIDFAIQFIEVGDASLDLSGVLVPVPSHLVMDRAYAPVSGSGIYFSDQPVPSLNAPPETIHNYVFSNIIPGESNDGGTPDDTSDDFWISPFGETTTALFFYLPETLTSPSGITELRWKGRNDDDSGPAAQNSPNGTLISSQALLLANTNERLTFLSNPITTKIGENRTPVWNGYRITVRQNRSATVALAKLLARASDPDGDPITLSLATPTALEGGTLGFGADGLTYTPPLDFTGADELDLVLSDGDILVPARITVQVIPAGDSGAASANMISFELIDGKAVGVFSGIPDRSYLVQRSTDLIHWSPLETVTATSVGIIRFTDPTPPSPNAFYRTVSLP